MKIRHYLLLLTIYASCIMSNDASNISLNRFGNDIYTIAQELTIATTLALFSKLTTEEKERFKALVDLEIMAYSLIEQQELEKSLQEIS